ncbi:hypothetical protein TWF788_004300 [Orbilia oligospora]|uniref:Uncharacterized protein n=1 Tax=Orbilia oligospora TaxID=2813651 RepID=A0A7C8U713_ORBOL|nr:hypothetical protein TWF788_004300 [Orbilia oligospora]
MEVRPILKSYENQKTAGRGQAVLPTDSAHGYVSCRKPEHSTRPQHLYYGNIHNRTCAENPAAYSLAPEVVRLQQGCTCRRHTGCLPVQPNQSSQAPTHCLLSKTPVKNIQYPLANHRAMSKLSDEERTEQLWRTHLRQQGFNKMPNQYMDGSYGPRGNDPVAGFDLNAEHAQLPSRLAAFSIAGSGIHGRSGPEGVPRDSDRALQAQPPHNRAHGRGVTLISMNTTPKQRLNEEIKDLQQQQALDELDKIERGRDSRGRYITYQGEGYKPPFPTPNYSPLSSSKSSISSMSEPSSAAFEESSGEESDGRSNEESRRINPGLNSSSNGNADSSGGSAQKKHPIAHEFSPGWPDGPTSSMTAKKSDAKNPFEPIRAGKASKPQETARTARLPAFNLNNIPPIPVACFMANRHKPATASKMFEARAPTATPVQEGGNTTPVSELVALPPAPGVAVSVQASKVGTLTPVPALKGQIPVTPKLRTQGARSLDINTKGIPDQTTPLEKSSKIPSKSTPAQTKGGKAEWWQRWRSSYSGEIQVVATAPSLPPPYPCNVIKPRKGEVWIEDIDKELQPDGSEEPSSSTTEDWEMVEESEIYEQDERDWEAVKELDNDVAVRDRNEKRTRTYI